MPISSTPAWVIGLLAVKVLAPIARPPVPRAVLTSSPGCCGNRTGKSSLEKAGLVPLGAPRDVGATVEVYPATLTISSLSTAGVKSG
jgi:hypothetical protein